VDSSNVHHAFSLSALDSERQMRCVERMDEVWNDASDQVPFLKRIWAFPDRKWRPSQRMNECASRDISTSHARLENRSELSIAFPAALEALEAS